MKNVNKTSEIRLTFTSVTPQKKLFSKKSFQFKFLRLTVFLMIPLAILYDGFDGLSGFGAKK